MKSRSILVVATVLVTSCSARGQVGDLDSPYGLCVHAPSSSSEQRKVDRMMDAGVDWVRIDFVWQWVEPSQDSFNWSEFDSIANYVRSRERPLHVLANLQAPPAWAVKPGQAGVLNNTADLTDVLTRAVQRYQGTIDYWGLYNEPDFDSVWTGSRGEYIDQILKPGADAIHAASPKAKVVGPELSHLGSHQWHYWLKDCLEQASDKIDIVYHHTYADSHSTHNSRLNGDTFFGSSPNYWGWINPSLREVLEYTGWDGPVWLTEAGWNSDKSGGQPWQAQRLGEFLEDWFGDSPNEDDWLDKVFIYVMSDDPGRDTKGLLEADGTPKLAYHTYADFIAANPVPEPPAMGDANLDGLIDDTDLSILLANWGRAGGWQQGDFNGSGYVVSADLSILLANWSGIDGAVPDPATPGLLAVGAALLFRRRRNTAT